MRGVRRAPDVLMKGIDKKKSVHDLSFGMICVSWGGNA